ncbi:hypothetical protein ACFXG4_39605 [Nocardia sp. NPDC059246]|uniref:hypothetical protein n=1 Tax=unclassified Nocardia TaxID=2637762 RepID=UPI00367E02B7
MSSDAEDFIRRMLAETSTEPEDSGDLLADLARFSHYATALATALDGARPRRRHTAVGNDDSGVITVTIDADGQILDVGVADDWNHRIDPRQLGAAVVKAANNAIEASIQAMMPGDVEALERVATLRIEDFDTTPPVQPEFIRSVNQPTMSIDHLANAVLTAMESPGPSLEPPTFVGQSESSDGWVTAKVSAIGLVACSVPATWALEQHSISIRWAIMEAIADAREHMAAARPGSAGRNADLNLLINEGMNHLRSL